MNAIQCDLTVDTLESHIPQFSVDMATLVFVLSAIHPDKMLAVLQNIILVKNPLNCESPHPRQIEVFTASKGILTVLQGNLVRLVHRARHGELKWSSELATSEVNTVSLQCDNEHTVSVW